MSGDMLLAAPISSFGPHFDFVQSCAFAAPPANSRATEQPNTNALRIAVPPKCLALWLCAGQRLILAEVAHAIQNFRTPRCNRERRCGEEDRENFVRRNRERPNLFHDRE